MTTITHFFEPVLSQIQTSCKLNIPPVDGTTFTSEFIPFVATWDTGAMGCVIDHRVVQQLGLQPDGIKRVFTASSSEGILVNTYLVSMHLGAKLFFPYVRVTEGKLNSCDVLVGMNIITLGDFSLVHQDERIVFSFQIK